MIEIIFYKKKCREKMVVCQERSNRMMSWWKSRDGGGIEVGIEEEGFS
jgi:hypothetical protein